MLTACYCCFAVLCGWLEAILYARRGAEAFGFNEHVGMTLQRIAAALLVPLSMLAYAWHSWWLAGELVPAALLFPLCHDEAYNFTRLWLTESAVTGPAAAVWGVNVRPVLIRLLSRFGSDGTAFCRALQAYRYGYQSPSTTARNDFNGRQRTWLAALGLLLLLVLYLYLLLP